MNKKIMMNRISIILCFFVFFFLLIDKVEAKPTTCTYEYDINTETDGNPSKIQFSVNENDELILSTSISRNCYDADVNGTIEDDECSENSVENLILTQKNVENILDKTGKNLWMQGPLIKGDRNSEKFLSTMKTAFGWEKEQVHDVLDNGCTGTNCNVSIKLTPDGYCPRIYIAQNFTGTALTVMPSSIDCNGSKVFSWISGVTQPLSICHGKDTGGYDAIENRQCSNEGEIDQLIKEKVNNTTLGIEQDYENLRGSIRNIELDPSGRTDKTEIEKFCNQPLNQIENLANKISNYTDQTLPQDVLESILSDTKASYQNCRLSVTDDDIRQKAQSYYRNKIDSLYLNVSSLVSSAESKVRACIKEASVNDSISDDEEDELLDDLTQNTDQINDSVDNSFEMFKDKIESITFGGNITLNCEGILGDELLSIIDEIFGYVKIAAPILLLLLGSVDFGQAVLLDDKEALKKAGSKFIKRAIICVAIFFVPTVLSYILHFIDKVGVDPLCGIK